MMNFYGMLQSQVLKRERTQILGLMCNLGLPCDLLISCIAPADGKACNIMECITSGVQSSEG
jgi:hypothetical protein